jgi:putative ABC transport system permease protein
MLLHDLRTAWRACRLAPKRTALVAATLSVAIGLTTATFAVLYAVRIKPLPFHEPDRLVAVWLTAPPSDEWGMFPSTANTLRDEGGVLKDVAWSIRSSPQLSGSGDAEELRGAAVSASFFDVFEVRAQLGRTFFPADDRAGAAHVAVISERLWRRRFAADASAVGRRIRLDRELYEIVGVVPGSFKFPYDAEVWLPQTTIASERSHSGPGPYEVVARLAPNVSRHAAQEQLNRLAARMTFDPGTPDSIGVHLMPLNDVETADFEQPLILLFGSVLLVLVIACTNVGGLLAARSVQRRLEFAVRTCLGASATHLVSQLAAEGLVVSGLGTAGGMVLAWWILRVLIQLGHVSVPRIDEAHLSLPVVAFAAVITIATAILASLIPVWIATRIDKGVTEHATVVTPGSWRRAIRSIAVEIAVSVVLLVATTLFVLSLLRLSNVDSGIHVPDAFVATMRPTGPVYSTAVRKASFYKTLLTELRQTVGPETPVALSSAAPLRGGGALYPLVSAAGDVLGDAAPVSISDHYFSTLGIPMRSGRDFTDADGPAAVPVVVIDEKAAQLFGGNPMGQRITIRTAPNEISATIVGIVGNVRTFLALQPRAHVYVPIAQRPPARASLILRRTEPYAVLPFVKRTLRDLDPSMPLSDVTAIKAIASEQTAWLRFQTTMFGVFAVVAVWLTALGVGGVIAQSVSYRTREIGIRRALGATERAVQRLIMFQTLAPTVVGVLIGNVAAINAATLLRWYLFQVQPSEPLVYVVVTVMIVAVGIGASYLPSRAAAVVDPAVALRR